MTTPEEFRQRLRERDVDEVLDEYLLCDQAQHVPAEKVDYIGNKICKTFGVEIDAMQLWIVGSAKLGFSLTEKKQKDGSTLPRYRCFGADSDIDVAVVHPGIFEQIWNELSTHSHGSPFWPWDSGRLGDYLICGWFRPDHFPRGSQLRKCNDWWDGFRSMSNEAYLGRRQVRGGLFHSKDQLRRYLRRAVYECTRAEEIGI